MLFLLPLLNVQLVAAASDMQLVLVQTIWKYGDISPMETYENDPFRNNWTFAGGGPGRVSPLGMHQHMELGKKLRKLYVRTNFLTGTYTAKEIYIRAIDTDRAIISALSNLVGMYGQRSFGHSANVHFPDEKDWPQEYPPIPIHSGYRPIDDASVPGAPCRRFSELWKLVMDTDEMIEYQEDDTRKRLLEIVSRDCGQNITVENVQIVRNPLHAQTIHFPNTLRTHVPWYSDSLLYLLNEMYNHTAIRKSGILNETLVVNGVDVGFEMKKIRGGALIKEINSRMSLKLSCMERDDEECESIKPLRYYAYSAYGSTILQFFSLLGLEKNLTKDAYPPYAAAVTVELLVNTFDNRPYFRLLYRPGDESDFSPVTEQVEGCDKEYCQLEVFRSFAQKFDPGMSRRKLCEISLPAPPPTPAPKIGATIRLLPVLLMFPLYFM